MVAYHSLLIFDVLGDVAEEDPQIVPQLREDATAPSLDLLAPQAPALELLAARPRPPGVHFHSIIGDIYGKGQDGTDGLVPYKSAHLDGVDSEIIVPAGHTRLHQHPRAVIEVGRILMEHLQEYENMDSVRPARADAVTGGAGGPDAFRERTGAGAARPRVRMPRRARAWPSCGNTYRPLGSARGGRRRASVP